MKAGIKVLSLNAKHFERLLRVLEKHGDNFDLIRLFTAEGTADVLMLAFIIAESEEGAELFPEKWTLVTKDTGLLAAAKDYGITCTSELI